MRNLSLTSRMDIRAMPACELLHTMYRFEIRFCINIQDTNLMPTKEFNLMNISKFDLVQTYKIRSYSNKEFDLMQRPHSDT